METAGATFKKLGVIPLYNPRGPSVAKIVRKTDVIVIGAPGPPPTVSSVTNIFNQKKLFQMLYILPTFLNNYQLLGVLS